MQIRTAALVAAALAAAVGGCTAATTSKVTVSGKNLTIYLSAPATTDQQARDVVDAEQLAFAQQGGSIGSYTLKLQMLQSEKPSNNARSAISDKAAIAYLGELAPGTSADSAGITNAEDLLQVSPTDTALELTTSTPAVSGAPNSYYEAIKTYGRTFARVVPNTAKEAKAQVLEMQSLRLKRLYATNDGSPYGRAIAQALTTAAPPALQVAPTGPRAADAVFYGGTSASRASAFFNQTARDVPRVKLFASSALATPAFLAALSPQAVQNLVISQPAIDHRSYSAIARQSFAVPFARRYGHVPSPQAIFGYEAMAAILSVLHQDSSQANDRSKVVHDFFSIRNRQSVLGTYSIDANGDTSIAPFVFSRIKAGHLVPVRSVRVGG